MTERTSSPAVPSSPSAPANLVKDRAPDPQPSRPPLDDTLFGAVTVTVQTHTRITVSGPGIPRTTLVRTPGDAEPDAHIAIGTRAPASLALTVADTPADIRPGKGRFRRSTYRVDATHDGTRYRLTPTSIGTSTLTRDGVALAEFTADGDETVLVDWREDATPHPVDASLGYALAAAYGTGGQPMWLTLIDVITDFIP
ncbi:hypothetical protein [Streptomyces sp. NPDC051561]|uniref:hypothetical protein n=1 Tax=Streptomyces sp. NPDC051561 TaxID=3365658 RepID=UPI0037B91853